MKTVKGDLVKLALDGEFDVIIHGCNCHHIMGAGIALEIKNTFPEAWKADLATINGDNLKLGTISQSTTLEDSGKLLTIVNAYTQYGVGGNKPFNPEALVLALRQVRAFHHDKRIGFPAIGSGLGGGDWNEIFPIFESVLVGLDCTYVEYNK